MQLALTLLISAQTLLAMVLGNPALPQDFKDNATNIANNAIKVAQEEITKATIPQTSVSQVVEQKSLQTPSFGGIITVMDKSELLVTSTRVGDADVLNGIPYGTYFVTVQVLDKNGKTVGKTEVTMDAQDNFYGIQTRTTNEVVNKTTWQSTFGYVPTKSGNKLIKVTSNGLTKEITIDVQ